MPGSGKSSLWRRLAEHLWMDFLDIDDYMEEVTWRSVWDLLAQKWEQGFMEFERGITFWLKLENTVISCSGSIPLYEDAMSYLRKSGYSILINIPLDNIKQRLERMKVDRIIWMADGRLTLDQILERRQGFYEKCYDYSFDNDWLGTKEETFAAFMDFYKGLNLDLSK